MFQISGNVGLYGERLAVALGFVTLVSALATFSSCRSCLSFLGRFGLKSPIERRWYRSFYRYHGYYWWAFLFVLVLHLFVSHSLSRGEVVGFGITVAVVVVVLVLASGIIFNQRLRTAALGVLTSLWRSITHRDIENSVKIFDNTLTSGVDMIRAHPMVIIILLALIIGDWVSTLIALEFCFDALGNSLSLGVLVTGFAIGITAGVLSMVPGGLGVQEGSMAGIYALLGIPFEQAILAAILFRVVYYFIPFLISLGFYRRLLATNSP